MRDRGDRGELTGVGNAARGLGEPAADGDALVTSESASGGGRQIGAGRLGEQRQQLAVQIDGAADVGDARPAIGSDRPERRDARCERGCGLGEDGPPRARKGHDQPGLVRPRQVAQTVRMILQGLERPTPAFRERQGGVDERQREAANRDRRPRGNAVARESPVDREHAWTSGAACFQPSASDDFADGSWPVAISTSS